jgi:hypothetical protein
MYENNPMRLVMRQGERRHKSIVEKRSAYAVVRRIDASEKCRWGIGAVDRSK